MNLFVVLISFLITEILKNFFSELAESLNEAVRNLSQYVFYIEKSMGDSMGLSIDNITHTLINLGIAFIVLKFIYRGFCIYVVGNEGDSTNSPELLVLNFIKALALVFAFKFLYAELVDITLDLIKDLGGTLNIASNMDTDFLGDLGLFKLLILIVWVVLYVVFTIQITVSGLEMLVLRVGFPLACAGLLDSDGGVFNVYAKKFFQIAVTVVVQITLTGISLKLISTGASDIMLGIATLFMAIKTPSFIKEFMLFGGGGGGRFSRSVQTVSHLSRLVKFR